MNKANIEKIRIGRISFANVWPIFHFFNIQSLEPYAEIVSEVPTGLNRHLREGKIDVSTISAFAYGKDCERYVLLPDLSVSSYGRVNSILLFLKRPFEQAIHGKIALPQTSETSINLLKIIVSKFYGAFPEYITTVPSLDLMLEQADAALLIGDDAIKADWSNRTYPRVDLGEVWNQWTGHWMTYAVWAATKTAVQRWQSELSIIHQAFMESKRLGTHRRSEIVQTGCRLLGGTAEYWEHYFRQLTYDFGQPQRDGLQLYFRYANELGLIDHEVSIQLWSDKSVTQVKE